MALTVIKPSGIDTSGNYTVTGMNVSARASVANLSVTTSANLGTVSNVIITGGTEGYVLQTDGAGNLSWVAQSGGGSTSNISNGNSNVNIPTANGNINFTAVGNTTLIVTGTGANIAGTANVSGNLTVGNANLGNLVTANLFTGTLTTNAQPNITSVGTLTSLTVTGNVTGGNLVTAGKVYASEMLNGGTGIYLSAGPAGYINFFTTGGDKASISDTGNIIASNLIANSTVFATTANISANVTAGNANLGNLVTANYLTGTLTTAAQPNITSVGTLTDLSVSGNGVFGGNLTVNGTLTYINSTTLSISDPIINLQTGPNGAAPVANTGKDVGTALNYYDTTAKIAWMGWDISNAEIAFGSNVSITSEVVTFTSLANIRSGNAQLGNNVTANFFTGNGSLLTGIATSSVANGNSNVNIPTANGNINLTAVGNTTMVITGTGANIAGTLNVTGNATLGNIITSGSGGNITNVNVISANTFTASGTISAGNANLGNLVIANFFTGNGSILSALTFGNITTFNTAGLTTDELYLQSTTRLNVTASGSSGYLFDQYGATINPALYITSGQTLAFNLNVSGHPFLIQTSGGANYNVGLEHVDTTGTVLTTSSAQGQIAGTLYWKVPYGITGNYKYQCSIHGGMNGNIVVTDANVANITVGLATFATTANSVAGANVSGAVTYATTANAVAGANVSGQVSNSLISGTVYTNAQPNITSVGSLSGLTVSNATGVVDFTTTANVTLGVVGNLHISGGTNGYVLSTDGSGTLSWVAQSGGGGGGANISNGNSNVNIPSANGNINFTAGGNTNMVITSTGANISGTANITGNVTLSGANVSLGNVSNLHITGGSNTYVLSTDGSGNLSWAAASGTSIGVDNFTGNGVQTAYTLSTTPSNANATLVSIAGTFQPRTVYSLTGNVITFSSAPPNTAPIEVTTFTAGGGGGGGGITAQDLLSPFLLMGA